MYENPYKGMVKGYWYKAVMSNGAEFRFWSGHKLTRKEAYRLGLEAANGDYEGEDRPYEKEDIESVRRDMQ